MQKRKLITHWVFKNRICFYAFLLPFAIMLILFAAKGIFPFGEESFMHSDMYHQYVPFLQEFVRKVRSGESLYYSWNIGLGSNYLALFIYYSASPFNWLSLLFPAEYLIEFMSYMVIFKIGLAGFTFAYYVKKHFSTDSCLIVFFALFYAMSGFVAAYNWNVMWMDCLFLAPLIILGLERLVKEKKSSLYCITLALSILSNYYLSIMICIFLCLYFLVLLPELACGRGPSDFMKRAGKAAGRFALYSLLAGGMAAVLLLPELFYLSSSEFTQFHFPEKVTFYFSLFDMIARHATGVKAEAGLDHWPNIFCSSAVFLLIPLYVSNRKIPVHQKISRLALCAFLLLGFSTNILNYIWHGFNYPNSLPARQSFLYIFLVLTLCFEALYRRKGFGRTQLLHAFCLGFGFLLLAEKLVTDDAFSTSVFLMSMALLCCYTLLLYAVRRFPAALPRQAVFLLTLTLVVFEATYHMASTSVSTTSRSNYLKKLPAYESLAAQIKEEDPGFYRIEKFSRTTKNDGALADYPTATCFASTANANACNWYDRMGLSESKVFYSFDGQTPFSAALLNVRYMFSQSGTEDPALYTLVDEKDGIYLYRCRYTLPAGYVLPKDLQLSSKLLRSGTTDPLALQNAIVAQIIPGSQLFLPVSISDQGAEASFTAETSGHYYAYAQNSKVDTVKMKASSGDRTFKKLKYDYIMDLGLLNTGEQVTLSNEGDSLLDLTVYRLDTEVLSQALDILGSTAFTADSYDTLSLSGHVQLKEAGTLVLSVASEPGWNLLVNGSPAVPEAYDDMFLSVQLPAGEYEITLTFFPEGLIPGVCISLLSLAVFILLQSRRCKTAFLHENTLTKTL